MPEELTGDGRLRRLVDGYSRQLALEGRGSEALGAWFLGPKAENEDLFRKLVLQALSDHAADRRRYRSADPVWLTDERRESESYQSSVTLLRQEYGRLLDALDGSVPFFSYRYQGHMLWDTTLPAMLGYFAAMLYNQNNVAAEASPVTTRLEMVVGEDLCHMLGYGTQAGESGTRRPWGHLTSCGSVANIEAMWAARNLKLYPLAVKEALSKEDVLKPARDVDVELPGGTERNKVLELDPWQLLNLASDQVLALSHRIKTLCVNESGADALDPEAVDGALNRYTVQELGWKEFTDRFLRDVGEPAVLGPGTMHYSWPKGAAVLGLGRGNLVSVELDGEARMNLKSLKRGLRACLNGKRPVVMVVAVLGSTAEGAVDPLEDILDLRDGLRKEGLDFHVHVDAAWGGYFCSMLRAPAEDGRAEEAPSTVRALGAAQAAQSLTEITDALSTAELPADRRLDLTAPFTLSDYTKRQYEAMSRADSVTVDPHKAGYIPYPAGALCYRDAAMRDLVTFASPVIFRDEHRVDPTVGIFGLGGSKPGAAAAATYLSHRVIRPDRTGYGTILGRALFCSKRLYASLAAMETEEEPFVVETLRVRPAVGKGKPPKEIQKELELIRKRIVARENDELLKDPVAMELLQEMGPDQLIVAYAFNYRIDGERNTHLDRMNRFNQCIFRRLSLSTDKKGIPTVPLFVTSSKMDPATYGERVVGDFTTRLLGRSETERPVDFLISTTMDPWLSDTAEGNFIPELIRGLRATVRDVVAELEYWDGWEFD